VNISLRTISHIRDILMPTLQFLIALGVVNAVYIFAWRWVSLVFALILVALRLNRAGAYILKFIGWMLYGSILAVITIASVQSVRGWQQIAYPVTAALVMLMTLLRSSYDARKQALDEYNVELLETTQYDIYFILASLSYFILALFVPSIAANPLSVAFYKLLTWATDMPFLGVVLLLVGLASVAAFAFNGLLMAGALIGSAFIKDNPEQSLNQNKPKKYAVSPVEPKTQDGKSPSYNLTLAVVNQVREIFNSFSESSALDADLQKNFNEFISEAVYITLVELDVLASSHLGEKIWLDNRAALVGPLVEHYLLDVITGENYHEKKLQFEENMDHAYNQYKIKPHARLDMAMHGDLVKKLVNRLNTRAIFEDKDEVRKAARNIRVTEFMAKIPAGLDKALDPTM
jgi:hypothetical protein